MGIWGDFQGLTEATGGGRGVKKCENWGDVVYGWSPTEFRIFKDPFWFLIMIEFRRGAIIGKSPKLSINLNAKNKV